LVFKISSAALPVATASSSQSVRLIHARMSLSISKTKFIVSTRTNGHWELLCGCWRRHQMPQELSAVSDPPLGSFSLPADGAIKLLSLKKTPQSRSTTNS
jgi:hypothetical protein